MSDVPASNARILIVEDEAIVALDVRNRIEKLGYVAARTVSSGEEAVRVAPEVDPHLVLMDIQLSGEMDGIEAARIIREQTGKPVVFLTAYSDRSSLERAKVADAFGYVLKPFEERELGIAIEMALYKERMQRRLTESREWLHGTVAALFDGVVTTDAAGTVLFMNRRAVELTGWSEEEAIGRSAEEVVRVEAIPTAEFATGIIPEAVRLLRRDGSVAYVEHRVSDIAGTEGGTPAAVEGGGAAQAAETADGAGISGRVIVIRDVADILTYEREMRAAREQAERALKVKSEFLANVTHELRTPLNSVLGMADLAHGRANDPQQREYLGILKSSAENLFGLITSILDLSRIETGHLSLNPAETDLHRLVESAVESFALEAHTKGLTLELALDPATPAVVHADGVRLTQIISNLLANALQYTDEGSVTVSVTPGVRIEVADTGRGIPSAQQEAVFLPFTQVDSGPTRAHGGAGIGLAVARELAELMDGRIALESREGRGSTFTVELPLGASAVGAADGGAGVGAAEPAGGATARGRRALIVGEKSPGRESLVEWGRAVGAEVTAVTAAEIAATAGPRDADLVLLLDENAIAQAPELRVSHPRAAVWTTGLLGGEDGYRFGRRVLSRPVMPSTFVGLLREAGPSERTPKVADATAEPTSEEAAASLLERFSPESLEAAKLPEVAEAARRAREDSAGRGGRVEEILFRLTLAARRADLDAARALLSELDGQGATRRIGQTEQFQYNDER